MSKIDTSMFRMNIVELMSTSIIEWSKNIFEFNKSFINQQSIVIY